jgi:two-component sensor histidine kinase
MMPLLGEDGQPEGFVNVLRDNTKVRAEDERRALVLAEMGHRVRNTLATAQAIAAQTLRGSEVPSDVREAFTDRLRALARAHDLLLRSGWEGALLSEVLERSLAPFGGPGRVELGGVPVWLPVKTVERLGLAFHELATNAAKHGALAGPAGQVEVRWNLRRARSGSRLVDIVWREHGGPPVAPPTRRGFGSQLLERGLTQNFGGTVKLDFRPEGLECQICLPIATSEDGG